MTDILLSTPNEEVAKAIVGAVDQLNQETGANIKVEIVDGLKQDLQAIEDKVEELIDRTKNR